MADFLSQGEHVVGVDIGGTKLMAVVFDHKFRPIGRNKRKSKSNKGEPTEERLTRTIQEALEEAKVDAVRGIGVGSPGPLDPKTGVIIDTPNLAWKDFPLAQYLKKQFKTPVVVDNDVNVGTYGEYRFGEISGCESVLGVFPGTGIGAGIIIEREIFYGFSGAAGEFGHMTLEVDGPYCGCGKRGCLEALASRVAIAAQVAALAARGDAPYILANCGTDLEKIRSTVLADAVKAGEKMVEGVIRKAAYYVGVATGNAINILSPEAVVLGGGLVEAMPDLYLEEVKRGIKEHAMPFLRRNVRIVTAKLADDAVVMGAAYMIAERLGEL
ncbi:MAG TPA: ROK family protein [Candidatus Hydrogenedentes bacterium]|nr:ROK family protein [Candidatus Hydrogenedentota bacterium]HQM48678.1 ROK family protein [Candidatus Hydrogenedentota bacterium]